VTRLSRSIGSGSSGKEWNLRYSDLAAVINLSFFGFDNILRSSC